MGLDRESLIASVRDKQEQRYAVLWNIYDCSDASPYTQIPVDALAKVMKTELVAIASALNYLEDENLIKFIDDNATVLRIEHRGIIELESSVAHPEKETEHFPSNVIQHFHGDVYGGVQTGGQNNTQTVNVTSGHPTDAIIKLTELTKRSDLPDLYKEDAIHLLSRVSDLSKKEQTTDVRKLAKDKLDIFKTTVEAGKTLGEITTPLITMLYEYFT